MNTNDFNYGQTVSLKQLATFATLVDANLDLSRFIPLCRTSQWLDKQEAWC